MCGAFLPARLMRTQEVPPPQDPGNPRSVPAVPNRHPPAKSLGGDARLGIMPHTHGVWGLMATGPSLLQFDARLCYFIPSGGRVVGGSMQSPGVLLPPGVPRPTAAAAAALCNRLRTDACLPTRPCLLLPSEPAKEFLKLEGTQPGTNNSYLHFARGFLKFFCNSAIFCDISAMFPFLWVSA